MSPVHVIYRRGFLLLSLATGFASSLVAGCNIIVGAGDYKVGKLDGGGQQETSVATDAGCGSASLPVSSATFQQVVRSCVLAISCDPFYFQTTISNCVTNDYLTSVPSPTNRCLSTITSCGDYAGCTSNAIPNKTQCPSTSTTAYCNDAGLAVNCGADPNAAPYAKNCPAGNEVCNTYDDEAGVIADCLIPSDSTGTCTAAINNDGMNHCDTSNNEITCVNGMAYGRSCNGFNATCKEDPLNGTSCYFNGTKCPTPGYTCDTTANAVKWCTDGNVTFNFNCATSGLTCTDNPSNSSSNCVAPGCTIDDFNTCVESCDADGHHGTVCIGGAPYRIDCSDPMYGFRSCYDATTSTFGGIYCQY
jgi:hypothetical protein